MIFLLHEREYEMLGDIEIREEDWYRLRVQGPVRFVVGCLRSSPAGRIGALLLLTSVGGFHNLHHIDGWAGFSLVLGTWALFTSTLYAVNAWLRLERRFAPGSCPSERVP